MLSNPIDSYIGTYKAAAGDKPASAFPGAIILSGVFNQDGSDSPYLQPIVVNFNPNLEAETSTVPLKIPIYSSRPFFQLFNNYDCANVQLLSQAGGTATQYNVLLGGVSYFFKTQDAGEKSHYNYATYYII